MNSNSQTSNPDITHQIANALRQVKLAKEGKIRLNTLEKLINELDD